MSENSGSGVENPPVTATGEVPPSTQPPAEAGTVVLMRDGAGGPEVLMVRRGKRAAFMADAFVFPGGRADVGEPHGALGAAAREAFEEAGVLLAAPVGEGTHELVRTDGVPWVIEARRALLGKSSRFADLLAARGLRIAAEAMVPFARWVTPSSEPRRFDAHFFLARMPEAQTATPDAIEVSEHRWSTPRDLLAADRSGGDVKLPPPTQWHLENLSAHATVDDALAWARASRFALVRPKLAFLDNAIAVVLPWDPAFPSLAGEGDPTPPPGALGERYTRFLLVDGHWSPRHG